MFFSKLLAVEVAVKLQSRRKYVVLGATFSGRGYPKFVYMHFQSALTSEHVAVFRWVPFSELVGNLTKKEEKIAVKPKSADDYVGWPT